MSCNTNSVKHIAIFLRKNLTLVRLLSMISEESLARTELRTREAIVLLTLKNLLQRIAR